MSKILNDPSTGVEEEYISVKNTTASTLENGDVVVADFSSDEDALIQGAVGTTSALAGKVLGVVSQADGNTVAVGDYCRVMVRGLHKAVKKVSGTIARGDQIGTSTTSLMATKAGSAAAAGQQLGYCASAAATDDTTFVCRVDVK